MLNHCLIVNEEQSILAKGSAWCLRCKEKQVSRVQLKCECTRWSMGGKMKGKLANGVCSLFTLSRNMVYPALLPLLPLMLIPRLPAVDWTDAPADLNVLICFAERQNLASAWVPLHFKCSLPCWVSHNGLFTITRTMCVSLMSTCTWSPPHTQKQQESKFLIGTTLLIFLYKLALW